MKSFAITGLVLALCGCASRGPSDHQLHVVEGETVYSAPPSTTAYAAYLRCRLALEDDPPRLDEARAEIDAAIAADGRDPHLWTVRAEIDARRGDSAAALSSVKRALSLRPGYEPAQALAARLGQGPRSAAADR